MGQFVNNPEENFLKYQNLLKYRWKWLSGLDAALEALVDEILLDLMPIMDWFEDFYIGRPGRNQTRRRALFPPETWSVYERSRTIIGEGRTKNHVEGAHRRLQAEFGMCHPTIWKFTDGIRAVQKGRNCLYEQFVRGDLPPVERRK